MKPAPRAALAILLHLIFGMLILIGSGILEIDNSLLMSSIVLSAFGILNLVETRLLGLGKSVSHYWSFKTIVYLPLAILAGSLIGNFPGFIALVLGKADPLLLPDLSLYSIAVTFVIVFWEELWFRGVYLNYCMRYLPPIVISLIAGALFMLMHILNPQIELMITGPALFFAGAFLTLSYFYFKSIWVPVGLHFGNNFFGQALAGHSDLLQEDGYISALIMAILFLILAMRYSKRTGH